MGEVMLISENQIKNIERHSDTVKKVNCLNNHVFFIGKEKWIELVEITNESTEDDYDILDDLGHMHECEKDYGYDGEY